ncbi:MAG: type II secretion system protein [Phycisphaerae bacterium]|nr:type II secretion system protein [Phycisphaerae bacterium]
MTEYRAISGRRVAVSQRGSTRRAFTLVELIVSVAILLALMAMIGMIFSTAGKASGTAQATTALYRQLRQITDSIQQDLQAVVPTDGVLAIAGVTVSAHLTADDRTNGVSPAPHQADVLMLLNKQDFDPFVFDPGPSGPTFEQYRQVVYGHANLARLNPTNGSWLPGTTRMVEGSPSAIPASQWHLARRIVGFTKLGIAGANTGVWPLTSVAFTGETGTPDTYADVYREAWSAFDSGVWPGHFHYDEANLDFSFFVGAGEKFLWDPNRYFSPGGSFVLADKKWYTRAGNIWRRKGALDAGYTTYVPTTTVFPTFGSSGSPAYWPQWFYVHDPSRPGSSRSFIDPNPPLGMEKRLAAYFLPGCADFKVEYTYDDPREIALNPSTNEPDVATWLDQDKDAKGTAEEYYPKPQPIRWQAVPSGQVVVWSKLSTSPGDYPEANTNDVDLRDKSNPFRWPKAVRITIRLFDASRRLTDPVVQTIVHAWE